VKRRQQGLGNMGSKTLRKLLRSLPRTPQPYLVPPPVNHVNELVEPPLYENLHNFKVSEVRRGVQGRVLHLRVHRINVLVLVEPPLDLFLPPCACSRHKFICPLLPRRIIKNENTVAVLPLKSPLLVTPFTRSHPGNAPNLQSAVQSGGLGVGVVDRHPRHYGYHVERRKLLRSPVSAEVVLFNVAELCSLKSVNGLILR